MLLDLLNASPEVLPAYEYLLSLGVNLTQAAKILTDPIVSRLVDACRGNLFENKAAIGRMTNLLSKPPALLLAAITGQKEGSISLNDERYTPYLQKLKVLQRLFDGAQELTAIGIALGINGGINVQVGDPLLYQLNFERSVNMAAKGLLSGFNLVRFVKDQDYANTWINALNEKAEGYNILNIFNTVPHYRAMLEVPLRFKNIMQTMSKDIDNTYTWAYENGKHMYKIDSDTIKQALRVFNNRKIFDFFREVPFVYTSPTVLENKVFNGNLIHNVFTKQHVNPVELSTATPVGLATLKSHIEDDIIPAMKQRYSNNSFVQNIMRNSSYDPLFGEKFSAYASRINLGDPQYEDELGMIKSDFYNIKDKMIDGHSVFEWMFAYDLLCYKHTINRNSFSPLFDNSIDLSNNSNIMTRWINYINSYDSSSQAMPQLAELNAIPHLQPVNSRKFTTLETEYDNIDDGLDVSDYHKKTRPKWATDPNILPLFVKIEEFDNQTFLNRNLLSRAFAKGLITVTLC